MCGWWCVKCICAYLEIRNWVPLLIMESIIAVCVCGIHALWRRNGLGCTVC